MGRPKKYTKKSLEEAVAAYFDGITRIVKVTEKVDSGKKDSNGHVIYEQMPVENKLGKQLEITEYLVAPTVGGLCEFLEIHRSTWSEWCDEDKHPEFKDTIATVQGRLRAWREEQLLTRKDVKGIIFDLQNNYGYSEKRQVELGERASKTMAVAAMPIRERRELLEQIAREFSGGGDTVAED